MNTVTETALAPAPVAPATIPPQRKFFQLVKREFWENQGAFVRAPLICSLIFLLFTLVGLVAGHLSLGRMDLGAGSVNINGRHLAMDHADFNSVLAHASAADRQRLHDVVNNALLVSSGWALLTLGFVVFFYFVGTLYSERRDRSLLFWKSLPVSDTQTVLAKLTAGLAVAPMISLAICYLTLIVNVVLFAGFMATHHMPAGLLLGELDPVQLLMTPLTALPLYMIWALPTVGWLMLCSAWARSQPFIWATLVPVLAGVAASWLHALGALPLSPGWFWKNIVLRLLGSVFPGTQFIAVSHEANLDHVNPFSLQAQIAGFSDPSLWIGAIAGIVMIAIAIRLRRWRTED